MKEDAENIRIDYMDVFDSEAEVYNSESPAFYLQPRGTGTLIVDYRYNRDNVAKIHRLFDLDGNIVFERDRDDPVFD